MIRATHEDTLRESRARQPIEWRPASALIGRRFATEDDVDAALDPLSKELKARVREGFTVVVK